MTPQEFFDLTVLHLWRQGGPARVVGGEKAGCKYLSEDGKRCAGGYWMNPAKYDSRMEGVVLNAPSVKSEKRDPMDALRPEALECANIVLLRDLQAAHDNALYKDGKWIIGSDSTYGIHRSLQRAARDNELDSALSDTLFA